MRESEIPNTSCPCGPELLALGHVVKRLEGFQYKKGQSSGQSHWQIEPDVGRVVDGISPGMDRFIWECQIRALGNAIVPQVSEEIGRFIKGAIE